MSNTNTNGTNGNSYTPRAGSKEEIIKKLALRPQGVSGKEAKAALGWKAIQLVKHVNDIASGMGLEYEWFPRGREMVYRIVGAAPAKAKKVAAKKVAAPAKVVAAATKKAPAKKTTRRAA